MLSFFCFFFYSPLFNAPSVEQGLVGFLTPVLLGAAFSFAISTDTYCLTTLRSDVESEHFYFELIKKIYEISIGAALFITVHKSNTVEDVDRFRKKIADCLDELTIIISYGPSSSGKIPYELLRTTEKIKKDFDTAYCTKKCTNILDSIVSLSNVMHDAYQEDKEFCKRTDTYFVNSYHSRCNKKNFKHVGTNSSLTTPLDNSELQGVFEKFKHISPSLKRELFNNP